MVSSDFGAIDWQIMLVLAGMGLVVGLLPAWRGLRTPVAQNINPDGLTA